MIFITLTYNWKFHFENVNYSNAIVIHTIVDIRIIGLCTSSNLALSTPWALNVSCVIYQNVCEKNVSYFQSNCITLAHNWNESYRFVRNSFQNWKLCRFKCRSDTHRVICTFTFPIQLLFCFILRSWIQSLAKLFEKQFRILFFRFVGTSIGNNLN